MRKKRIVVSLILLWIMVLTGCKTQGENDDGITYFHHSVTEQQETQVASEVQQEQELYLVTAVDQMEESLQLYRYANGMEYRYYYGTGTRFYDKYGTRTTVNSFVQGTLVTIGTVNTEGFLDQLQISDQGWVYDDVTRFSVDTEKKILKIADSNYQYSENTYVFSGENTISMEEIAQGDTLCVVGMDKKILSVRLTTAQGTLKLTNTSLFEGSFLQLGTKIFAEITPDMEMQVPEGTYDLIVANNGWGGSREITIERGETTTVDLDELKGSGPKSGKIQFLIDVEGAVLLIDGTEVDYTDPIKLTYGSHRLEVYATGYDVWQRNLYVNSQKSTIVISLTDEEDETDTADSSQQSTTSGLQSSESDDSQSTQSSSEDSSQIKADMESELEYMQDLISSMSSASSILTN